MVITLGSELEAALEELRLIRALRPPANARVARPDRYVYLRRRGDGLVCSAQPTELGPIRSRSRARLAARALAGASEDRTSLMLQMIAQKSEKCLRSPCMMTHLRPSWIDGSIPTVMGRRRRGSSVF